MFHPLPVDAHVQQKQLNIVYFYHRARLCYVICGKEGTCVYAQESFHLQGRIHQKYSGTSFLFVYKNTLLKYRVHSDKIGGVF